MIPPRTIRFTIFSFIICCLSLSSAKADTLVIGNSTSNNALPFGANNTVFTGEYQQIYAKDKFPGAITITQLAFASSDANGFQDPGSVTYNLVVNLGTATAPVTSPFANFNANKGPDFTTVFSGTLNESLLANNTFDLFINLDNPFTYNPANGSLLLDVNIISGQTLSGGLRGYNNFQFVAGFSPDISRVFTFMPPDATPFVYAEPGYGLYTQFTFNQQQPVPEPATMLLLGTGLAGIAGAINRRRNKS